MQIKPAKKPFFARFLENQDLTTVQGAAWTKKYPSDRDEDLTMKYPSDSDETFEEPFE